MGTGAVFGNAIPVSVVRYRRTVPDVFWKLIKMKILRI